MRLIDADEFFKNFPELDIEPYNNAPTITDHSRELVQKSIELGRKVGYFEGKIENKRPHGKWIKNDTRPNEYQCDNCGNYDLDYFPFCHWCGADMRGGEQ